MLKALFDRRFQMAQLWTSLTRERRDVPLINEHRELLAAMSHDRTDVHERVIVVMGRLVKLSVDLSDLRRRVVQPVLVPEDGAMHCQMYLESLTQGVDNLDTFRQDSIKRCVPWRFLHFIKALRSSPHSEKEFLRRLVAESLSRGTH